MRTIIALIALVVSATISGTPYPTDYFRSPVGIPILLSGSFGEMRSNHFHTGMDIRTRGRSGYRVYAAAEGHISRISVSPSGFGNALYVDHPNGYTTVYAHLLRFEDPITDYVKRAQYDQERFAVTLYPEPGRFPVEKGEVIALSGNSGSSGGPHLHFEIRETETQDPINPILFGMPVSDTHPPGVRSVKVYTRDPESFAVVHRTHGQPVTVSMLQPARFPVAGGGRSHRIAGVDRIEARGRVGFGIEIRDTHNGSGFRLGAYRVRLTANDSLLWGYEMERLRFSENRYLNAHIDYEERLRNRRWTERSYVLPGNRLPIYLQTGDGWLNVREGQAAQVRYEIEDAMGNRSILPIPITWADEPIEVPRTPVPYVTLVPYNYPHVYTAPGIALQFPAGAVYDDLPLRYAAHGRYSAGFSDLHEIHDRFVPLHRPYELSIEATGLPESLRSKALVALLDTDSDRFYSLGGKYDNGYVTTTTRSFGNVYIAVDTLGPEIRPFGFPRANNFRLQGTLRLKVEDELSGLAHYAGTVDDDWILFVYDAKSDMMIHHFDDRIASGTHSLRFTARDNAGNETVYTTRFTR